MPAPWEEFRDNAKNAVTTISVSHRVRRKIHGALHEETIYGPTDKPGIYARRKPITELSNTKHLAKVRDPVIREILKQQVREHGIDPDRPGKIPADAWKETATMPSGVPIRKVRMLEESDTFQKIRPGGFVKLGSNHHIVYRKNTASPNAPWEGKVVTMLEAAQRVKQKLPIVDRSDRDDQRFIMSLSIGEMFLIEENGEEKLCVVRKIDQRSRRVNYKLHADARPAKLIDADNLYLSPSKMRRVNARKVTVDLLGTIRWAND